MSTSQTTTTGTAPEATSLDQTALDQAALAAAIDTAAAAALKVVDGLTPAAFDRPNPTSDWDTRTLANHFIAWSAYALDRRGRREPMDEQITEHDFLADSHWRDDYAATLRRAVQTWSAPATFAGDVDTGHASMPAADIAAMLLLETVLHGWDVASATGQRYQGYVDDPGFGETMLRVVQQWAPMYRQYDGFAAEVAVADDAPALDRALALSGRDPNWTPVTADT